MRVKVIEKKSADLTITIECPNKDTREIEEILLLLGNVGKRVLVMKDKEKFLLSPRDVLYAEFVDGTVYVYTEEAMYTTHLSLYYLEKEFEAFGWFRCCKSMIVNIMRIKALKSDVAGKVLLTLDSGERLIVSRKYASLLRAKLSS